MVYGFEFEKGEVIDGVFMVIEGFFANFLGKINKFENKTKNKKLKK